MKKCCILIANHNYGQWVGNAIQSALNQTYPCNVCVIDDGSTDNSREKIEENSFQKPKVAIIYNSTAQGPSAARNLGIKGTWDNTDIWFVLDADDEFAPSKVKRFLEEFEDPNVGLVYGDYDTVDEDGCVVRNWKEPFSRNRLFQECIVHSSAAFTKKALENIGIKKGDPVYDEGMRTCEDYDLWCRLTKGTMAIHIPESLTKVRVHSQNSTNTVHSEVWQENWGKIRTRLQNGTY
jgi:glycosyltransferase involved in cell wall biosynthesis